MHLIPAVRGKRLNVLAALISTGELFSAKIWQNTTADAFTGFLGLLIDHVNKPLTIILDNASIHKAKANAHIMEFFKKQGVVFYFLPAYSPELNRIETLWGVIKHTWMSAKNRTAKMLEEDLNEILLNFCSKYKFKF